MFNEGELIRSQGPTWRASKSDRSAPNADEPSGPDADSSEASQLSYSASLPSKTTIEQILR